jgi:CheY-like chemotaxis protein
MADARTLLRLLLTHKGHYTVVEAINGHQALEEIRANTPHLIILDYMMPDLNGIEVVQSLRRDPATAGVPVIMLTARTDQRTRDEAVRAGVNAFITKPIRPEVLLMETQRLLEQRSEVRASF